MACGLFLRLPRLLVVVCAALSLLLFPTANVVTPADHLAVPGFRLEKPQIQVSDMLRGGQSLPAVHCALTASYDVLVRRLRSVSWTD